MFNNLGCIRIQRINTVAFLFDDLDGIARNQQDIGEVRHAIHNYCYLLSTELMIRH